MGWWGAVQFRHTLGEKACSSSCVTWTLELIGVDLNSLIIFCLHFVHRPHSIGRPAGPYKGTSSAFSMLQSKQIVSLTISLYSSCEMKPARSEMTDLSVLTSSTVDVPLPFSYSSLAIANLQGLLQAPSVNHSHTWDWICSRMNQAHFCYIIIAIW